MFSSIVKAGMKAITPRGKKNEEDNNKPLTRANLPTTPKNYSQASIATPSTAATVDITANTTFESITLQQQQQQQPKTALGDDEKDARSDSNSDSNPAMESTETNKPTTETTASVSIPQLWKVLDRQLRSNIGTSVRCGICLSTVSDPVRTPCSHGFCRSCISSYLRHCTNSCPECKAPCTRRSLETFSELDEMADSYKAMLRAFGLAPGMYTPEITTMTQKVVDTGGDDDHHQVANFDDENLEEDEAREARLDRLCVSSAYQKALPACSKLQIEENEQVVAANFEACFGEDQQDDELEAMNTLFKSCLNAKNQIPLSSQAMPNTQDVHEQAREQLEADREMQESMEAEQNEVHETDPLPNDHDHDEDFFTLRKTKSDPFELPEEPQASPPIFARADTATKNLRHTTTAKSFSKRDSSEQRPSFPLSPIDHEKSFETSRLSTSSRSMSKENVTGMLEDSRGGLHMMAMSGVARDKDAGSDFDDDKTIAFTMDDSPAFSKSSGGEKDESNDDDNKESHSHDNSSCSSNDSPEGNEYQLPLTYDPIGHPTEITEEYHTSTKTEITNAANLPAGREVGEEKLKTKKALFPESNKKKKKTDIRKSSRRRAAKEQEDILSKLDSNTSESSNQPNDIVEEASPGFPVGTIVRVQARTWPGVNKQGGVGRITGYNSDGTYNVSYVLGGKESKIDAVFVSKEDQSDDDGNTEDASAASKRRRRAKNMLPEELLKQLAEEGFDVPGLKAKPKKKTGKPKEALADSTNQRGAKRKRAASRASEEGPTNEIPQKQRKRRKQLPPAGETKSAKSYRRKQARKPEDAHLPTTVKKIKEAPATKKKTARKTVTWSTEASSRTRKKKPSPMLVDASPVESEYEKDFLIADALYKVRIENAIQNKSLVAVTSNLSEAERTLFSSLLNNQVLKAGYSVDETTQICIVPALGNETNEQSVASVRTLKVMLSALKGIPLVTPDWVKTCFLEKRMIVPNRFLRSIPTKDPVLQASGDALCGVSKLAVTQEQLPFNNVFACLCGGYEGKTKASMQELLEVGGAKILSTSHEVEAKLQEISTGSNSNLERIVVVCGNSVRGSSSRKSGIKLASPATSGLKKFLKHRQLEPLEQQQQPALAMVVDSQWVIESVTCAKAMPPNLFEPSILKDLWKLCL